MRNETEAPCCLCKENIPAGRGVWVKTGGRRLSTHEGHCPKTSHGEAVATRQLRRIRAGLADPCTDAKTTHFMLTLLGNYGRAGWITESEASAVAFASPAAARNVDRIAFEEYMQVYFSGHASVG